jgi:hypothetical protein
VSLRYSGLLAMLMATSGPPANIFLVSAGQSNGVAAGTQGQPLPSNPANFFIWNSTTGAYEPYVAGTNSDPKGDNGVPPNTAWGPELGFVQALREAGDNRPVYCVKWAVGGTALEVGWKPGSGTHWNTLVARRAAARAALPASRTEVVNFNQGEADAQNGYASLYAGNIGSFITQYRALDADAAASIICVARIRPYTAVPYADTYAVRAAQEAAAARVIDLDFDPSNFASLHPGPTWVDGVGARFYAAWANNVVIGDITPSNLGSFTDVSGAATAALITSNEITIAGIDRSTTVEISGGEYRVRHPDNTDAVAWTSSPGIIHPHQKLTLRTASSGSASTGVNVTVTVGGGDEQWSVTTAANTPIISGTPGAATVGVSYTFTPSVTGGTPGYTFAVVAGTLPAGLSINGSTGEITGTPTTAGTSGGITIRVTDSLGATDDLAELSITVSAATLVAWDATVNNPTGSPNIAYSNSNRTASTSANTSALRTTRTPASTGKNSGLWYFCVESSGVTTGGSRGFGLILQAVPPGAGTLGTNRWSWSGTTVNSNSTARAMPFNVTTANGRVELAVNLLTNLFWVRREGVGDFWNNDPAADPAAGVGGLSCSGRGANAVFPLAVLPNTTLTASWTFVAGTPPSGFTQWS